MLKRREKVKVEKKSEPMQAEIRIVTNGVPNVRDKCCIWFWTAFDADNNIVTNKSGIRDDSHRLTSNSAKFYGVIEALSWLAENMPDKPVRVICDVEFIVKLVNGQCRTYKPHLVSLNQIARQFLSRTKATLEWQPRSKDKEVKKLKRAIRRQDLPRVERNSHANV
jgi:ribonuclease HI